MGSRRGDGASGWAPGFPAMAVPWLNSMVYGRYKKLVNGVYSGL